MRICVFGLHHLGCVTAACLAEAGNEVVAVDTDATVVKNLRAGKPPLYEPGLAELLAAAVAAPRLTFTTDLSAVAETELVWVCHDTPVDDDDKADVGFVMDQVRATFPYLPDGAVLLISAQLPVGSIAALERDFGAATSERAVSFACSPENLRLGKAIDIFRHPGRIVIGMRDERSREMLAPLLGRFTDNLIWMSVESAEMAKHALNAFLAVSITFTNELASICEKVGADATEVEKALRSEPRIGQSAYVRPGPAFAGGTLARDVQFLSAVAARTNLDTPLIGAVVASNRAHGKWMVNQLRDRLQPLAGRRIAVLGLSYKPGTDSIRRSTAIDLLRDLVAEGAEIRAFDPAVRSLPQDLAAKVTLSPRVSAALAGAEAVVVATDWPEFRALSEADLSGVSDGCVLLDPSRCLYPSLAKTERAKLVSVGTPS
jgi:UDPglucose 6-dehydrogenase